ncbi:hypothetical protein HY413_03675 [Candidatus Kaiserbacteria bacterium]|nr:hypothetical protein [Candidatus Kaiserbacteria bacterium]
MKVRPRGWGFLFVFCLCTDALQFLMEAIGLVVGLTGVGLIVTALLFFLSTVQSIFVRVVIFIWKNHHEIPGGFAHALVPTIAELIPGINWLPFWTIYALTYWVEEEQGTYS